MLINQHHLRIDRSDGHATLNVSLPETPGQSNTSAADSNGALAPRTEQLVEPPHMRKADRRHRSGKTRQEEEKQVGEGESLMIKKRTCGKTAFDLGLPHEQAKFTVLFFLLLFFRERVSLRRHHGGHANGRGGGGGRAIIRSDRDALKGREGVEEPQVLS